MVLAVFASIFAPFGGFFASGFKRAFKMKDFGDTIPGALGGGRRWSQGALAADGAACAALGALLRQAPWHRRWLDIAFLDLWCWVPRLLCRACPAFGPRCRPAATPARPRPHSPPADLWPLLPPRWQATAA
jgi:hypothetical protein